MKVFIAVLAISSLFGLISAQVTAAQAAGTWIDDGTNSGVDVTKCCSPLGTSLTFSVGSTSSRISVSGKWGTGAACTTLGLAGNTISATDNTVTTSTFPLPIAYSTTIAASSNSLTAATATTASLSYKVGSITCTVPLKTDATVTANDPSTWGTLYLSSAITPTTGCCYPTTTTTTAPTTTNVKVTGTSTAPVVSWIWDTTTYATQCAAAGLSGTFTSSSATNAAGTVNFAIPETTAASASVVTLPTASTGNIVYVTNLGTCTYNIKKSSVNLSVSIMGILLAAVGIIAF